MPVTTPQVKVDAVRAHGGATVEVVQFGESYSDAYGHAVKLQEERGLTFVHPFDDPYVIAGQGTVAMEILQPASRPDPRDLRADRRRRPGGRRRCVREIGAPGDQGDRRTDR